MKKLTLTLIAIGIDEFIFSFHSPSVKVGLTPYVQTTQELKTFINGTLKYIQWFNCNKSEVNN